MEPYSSMVASITEALKPVSPPAPPPQASYLFQQDKFYDVSHDIGRQVCPVQQEARCFQVLACGRLWEPELEQRVDRALWPGLSEEMHIRRLQLTLRRDKRANFTTTDHRPGRTCDI
ncbi:acidic amino acid decarboxylase GADL1 [Lates japonicus]|uniref:Acidic amino acid decarboxylase GADL1 n=1 Tax=Lates japonicus TaxID=270547 RepID=A0AAD3NI97_LATJO|nr:acidic amino acid decarboxylase GADL1 [Lates japonicus]